MRKNRERIGIFTVDPGGTTGLAWGLANAPTSGKASWQDVFKNLQHAGSASVEHGNNQSDIVVHNQRVMNWWEEFVDTVARQVDHYVFVVEDFILRPNVKGGSARSGLAPVRHGSVLQWEIMTRWMDDGDVEFVYQSASRAKGMVTDARLRDCEHWVRGREHERDARRHLGLRVALELERLAKKPRD
jgi:hypothetical protein